MGSGVKVVIGLIMVAVLMIVFPIVMSATHDLQTEEQTDSDLAITANVTTLTKDLWQADTGSVISITGDNTTDEITALSYVKATKALTLGGVVGSTTATVVYEIDGLTSYTGMGSLVGITPLLIWIAVIATVIGGIWFAVKGRG